MKHMLVSIPLSLPNLSSFLLFLSPLLLISFQHWILQHLQTVPQSKELLLWHTQDETQQSKCLSAVRIFYPEYFSGTICPTLTIFGMCVRLGLRCACWILGIQITWYTWVMVSWPQFKIHIQIPSDRLRRAYVVQYCSGYCKSENLRGSSRVLWGYSAVTACTVAPVTVASEYPQRYQYSNLQ